MSIASRAELFFLVGSCKLCRSALAGPICALVLLFSPYAFANSVVSQLVLSTDSAPGAGAAFGSLFSPTVNDQGCIAFVGGPSSAIYSTAHGQACGALARTVGAGDVPPGVLGPFSGVDFPALNGSGAIAFRGFGADTSNRGIYSLLGPGKLKRVADAGTIRPGTSEIFSAIGAGAPLAYDGKYLIFGDATASTEGVYRAAIAAAPTRITLSEIVSNEDGFTELSSSELSVNSGGDAAMSLRRAIDLAYGVYIARPGIQLTVIAVAGDSTATGDTLDVAFTPSINSGGAIAFVASLVDGSGGIFLKRKSGQIANIIRGQAPVPRHPGVFFSGVGNPQLGDDGSLVFLGRYILPDPNDPRMRLQFSGIYKRTAAGLKVIFDQFDGIMVNGKRVSLVERDPRGVQRASVGTGFPLRHGSRRNDEGCVPAAASRAHQRNLQSHQQMNVVARERRPVVCAAGWGSLELYGCAGPVGPMMGPAFNAAKGDGHRALTATPSSTAPGTE